MQDVMKRYAVTHAGVPLDQAKAAMILLHGRGGTAQDVLSLVAGFSAPDIAYWAPQAPGRSWYPVSFLSPIEQNEPHVSLSIDMLDDLTRSLSEAGCGYERILILGFSQGACLSLEFAARHPRRYGGIAALSGGLIGQRLRKDYQGDLQATPVFLGCSDVDSHIPKARVDESAVVMETLKATVTKRIYPNMGHTINADEIRYVRDMIRSLSQEF